MGPPFLPTKGSRVLLRTYDGDVEGIVVNVSKATQAITLNKVVVVDTGVPINSVMHFYQSNIKSCKVLVFVPAKENQPDKAPRKMPLLSVHHLPASPEHLDSTLKDYELICHPFDESAEVITEGSVQMIGPPEHLPKLSDPLATEFQVVGQAGAKLDDALSAINREKSIAVGFEGIEVGRNGALLVLTVVAGTKVFIFDVFSLEDTLFDRGLREVMESGKIEKVIHGCRGLSDCLRHKYRVELENVYDTQVADMYILHNRFGNKRYSRDNGTQPSILRGMQQCLRSLLHWSEDQLKYTRTCQDQQEAEPMTWCLRPLSDRQLDALVKDVVFLPELRNVSYRELAPGFWRGVRCNLCFNRDLDSEELEYAPKDFILPSTVLDAFTSQANFKEQSSDRRRREEGAHGDYRSHGRDSSWQQLKRGSSPYTSQVQHSGHNQGYYGHGCGKDRGLFLDFPQRCPSKPNYKEAAGLDDSLLLLGLNDRATVPVEKHQPSPKAMQPRDVPEPFSAPASDGVALGPRSDPNCETLASHRHLEAAEASVVKVAHVANNVVPTPREDCDWGSREISSAPRLRFRPADMIVPKAPL